MYQKHTKHDVTSTTDKTNINDFVYYSTITFSLIIYKLHWLGLTSVPNSYT